jgi:histidine triad (HIT) family protein
MTDSCLFCRIVRKEIPSRIVHENEEAVVFEDIHPQAPFHVLIVPRRHIESLSDMKAQDADLIGRLVWTAQKIAQEKGIASDGYRVVINSGTAGGQTVLHLHLHLLGGRQMAWPPG